MRRLKIQFIIKLVTFEYSIRILKAHLITDNDYIKINWLQSTIKHSNEAKKIVRKMRMLH